eukprot:CAMPEP_0178410536 /NCGR_PEP_ID=MMETSP0689_2-20121128/21029_1 /TAXON_ID=160604 /ORGANISM="Amphidinium massartii, Strain CS-259" /LENGTH=31 /DNA_ID= /DNA_START= /DNA_END= /DNA_ORIENTATION=
MKAVHIMAMIVLRNQDAQLILFKSVRMRNGP